MGFAAKSALQYLDLFCETRRIEVLLKSWDLVKLVTLLPGGFCRRTRSPHTLLHFPIPGFTEGIPWYLCYATNDHMIEHSHLPFRPLLVLWRPRFKNKKLWIKNQALARPKAWRERLKSDKCRSESQFRCISSFILRRLNLECRYHIP